MRKTGTVVVVVLLSLSLLAPSAGAYRGHRHHGHYGGFFVGLGIATLLTAPLWYRPVYVYPRYSPVYTYPVPVTYPAYAPTYTYPAYTTPYSGPAYSAPSTTSPTPALRPPGSPGLAETRSAPHRSPTESEQSPGSATPPAVPARPDVSAQSCETVWVEGHYETQVVSSGQRLRLWVPWHSQQVCR